MRSRAGSSEDVDVRAGMAQPRGPAGDHERAPWGGAGSLVAVFFDGIQPNIISKILATHLSTSEIGKMVAGAGYTIRVHRANDPIGRTDWTTSVTWSTILARQQCIFWEMTSLASASGAWSARLAGESGPA